MRCNTCTARRAAALQHMHQKRLEALEAVWRARPFASHHVCQVLPRCMQLSHEVAQARSCTLNICALLQASPLTHARSIHQTALQDNPLPCTVQWSGEQARPALTRTPFLQLQLRALSTSVATCQYKCLFISPINMMGRTCHSGSRQEHSSTSQSSSFWSRQEHGSNILS